MNIYFDAWERDSRMSFVGCWVTRVPIQARVMRLAVFAASVACSLNNLHCNECEPGEVSPCACGFQICQRFGTWNSCACSGMACCDPGFTPIRISETDVVSLNCQPGPTGALNTLCCPSL